MKTFGGLEPPYSSYKSAAVFLQPIPYDGTSTWGKGADKGLNAFIEASENMELYDIETGSEVYRKGIHLLPSVKENASPESVFKRVYQHAKELLQTDKFLTFLGGEHSVSIGIIKAFAEKYDDLTVVQLDAHADLRPEYLGSKYNHACALHEASQRTNLIQVGIRSMDVSEKEFLNEAQCYYAHEILESKKWMDKSIGQMTNDVYITIDLDVFDPSIMPATGTPEPGGMLWYPALQYLKKIFSNRNVVGFDIVELAPIEGLKGPDFLAAKLYYKLLSYKFLSHEY